MILPLPLTLVEFDHAFTALYPALVIHARRIGNEEIAYDLVHDAYLICRENILDRYDPATGGDGLLRFLVAVMENQCLQWRRTQARENTLVKENTLLYVQEQTSGDSGLSPEERVHDFFTRYRKAHLTHRQRDVMALLITGLTQKEVGERLGIRQQTVSQHHLAAIAHMRAYDPADVDPYFERLFTYLSKVTVYRRPSGVWKHRPGKKKLSEAVGRTNGNMNWRAAA